ncbi:N-6 DNA methylase [Hugenholtzia roseola]|uniref:N-6 DNA methylase n=1 Tax=Hugenholtzia roseola TaxID=1002 RepID=UPI00047D6128|nr:N-6 DNA methylase [Hugenholtzia roseola]
MEMKTTDLQSAINNIYNHLYGNSETRTPQGISIEVGKILHTAMYLEEQAKNGAAFEFSPKNIKDLRENANNCADIFAENLRKKFASMNSAWNFYELSDEIKLNNFDLAYTCSQLNYIKVSDTKRDVFGDTVEIIRGQWAKQIGGQFFTDSLVTKLAMYLLNFNPLNGDDLVDICAGTGGFLLSGLNHIREILEKQNIENVELELVKLAKNSLKGQEIDKEVCAVANATLTARLGKNDLPFVLNGDSLNFNNENLLGIGFDKHLCVASNPPFGTKITIKDYKVLKNFELAKSHSKNDFLFNEKLSFRSPDTLFVEQNVKLLKKGEGRLAIILPYQILSGPQTAFIRNWLLKNTIIQAVIDLPSETFQPHTGTKTCLLLAQRRKEVLENIENIEDYPVFMAIPKYIGHDRRGKTVYKKLPNGKNSNEVLTDFPELQKAFELYKSGENPTEKYENSYVISSKRIIKNDLLQLNAQFYKPSKFNSKIVVNEKWNFVKIEDVTENIFFPTRFKRNYVDYFKGAIPFFGGSDILQLISETGKWLSPDNPNIKDLTVRKDWILITRSGSTGIVSIVPEAWEGMAMSEHIIRIIPKTELINPYYLLGFLRSNYCKEILGKGIFGSVIDEIEPNFIGKIEIPIPNNKTEIQSIIAQIELAEKARNEAILNTQTGLSELNLLFEKHFT